MQESMADRLGPIDYLIVGGGSAGCVVASRLSERPDIRVVLLESGPAFTPASEPAAIGDIVTRSYLNPGYMWTSLKAVADGDPKDPDNGFPIPYVQPRVLGGGSSVNGMLAHRGLPGDYDEWSDFGVKGWGWNDVLPYFRKAESDRDFSGPLHGDTGPIPIMRYADADRSSFEKAIAAQWAERQVPVLPDLNSGDPIGRFACPLSMEDGHRVSSARAYLTEAVQARPNLTVVGDVAVTRLTFDGTRATGVAATGRDGPFRLAASHVILCAGAIGSPLLLQRSGIGDGEALAQIGVDSVAHRPGVGRNLQNHPTAILVAHLRRGARVKGKRAPCISGVRHSSGVAGCDEADLITTSMGMAPDATASNPLGRRLGAMLTLVHKCHSRGTVRPTREGDPKVAFNQFSDERDLDRLVIGWQSMREILTSAAAAEHVNDVFVPMSLGRSDDSLTTAAFNRFAGAVLDSSAAIRRRIIRRIGIPVEDIPLEGDALREWVRQFGFPAYHAGGTCRMGTSDDPQAVLDSDCKVIGVQGVSVVDASIFPTIMRSGTNLPAIMAAEKVSAAILRDNRHA